jgi:pimeloyl-ACP methyl ester carboxylesterase
LIIHAPDDKEVPVREARAYAACAPNARLFLADGLGHRRILADREVRARIASFAPGERRLALVG